MPSTLLYGARAKYYPIYVKIPWSRRFQHNTPRHGWIQQRNGCMTVGTKGNNMLTCICLPFLWEIKGNCFIIVNGLNGEGSTSVAQVLEENASLMRGLYFVWVCLLPDTEDRIHLAWSVHIWITQRGSHCKSVEGKMGFFTGIHWI